MVVSTSNDGQSWIEMGRATHSLDARKVQIVKQTLKVVGDANCQYIKIVGINTPTEQGLPGQGTVNWIFADEIFIN